MIERADYQRLMEIEAERKALIEKMTPHAKAVADAYFGQSVDAVAFWPEKLYVEVDEEAGGAIDMELIFDPEWKQKISVMHEERRLKHERIAARMAEKRLTEERERDLAELRRLQAKYPETV